MPNACDFIPDLTLRKIDSGRIQLLNILGAGSYGVVYRAIGCNHGLPNPSSISAGRTFAVKCMPHTRPSDRSSNKERHSREVEHHLAVSDHPNVLSIHAVIEEPDFIFLVLDFCPGGDLFTFINQPAFWRRDDKLKLVFLQILDAVEFCHSRSVYHRDLKPENILCSKDGDHVVLADFGLATRLPISNKFGCGSAFYMSPECIGKDVAFQAYSTRHSDIWSLGVILVNMVSGRGPWRRADLTDECFSCYAHDNDYIQNNLPISSGAASILLRIFTLNPQRRITLAQLRDEIKHLDTFFMTANDMAYAGRNARLIAASLDGYLLPSTNESASWDDLHDLRSRSRSSQLSDARSATSVDITDMEVPDSPTDHTKCACPDALWHHVTGSSRSTGLGRSITP